MNTVFYIPIDTSNDLDWDKIGFSVEEVRTKIGERIDEYTHIAEFYAHEERRISIDAEELPWTVVVEGHITAEDMAGYEPFELGHAKGHFGAPVTEITFGRLLSKFEAEMIASEFGRIIDAYC